jgi:hypothetical protein
VAGALSGNHTKSTSTITISEVEQGKDSIRTELLAHDKAKVRLAKQIPIDQLFKIEKVAIFLEGKGKQPSTIDSFRRHIAVLARNANLCNPQEVELAFARLKKTDPSTKKLTNIPIPNSTKENTLFFDIF